MQNDDIRPSSNPGLREFMKIARRNRPVTTKQRVMVSRPHAERTVAQVKAFLRIERGYRA